MQLIKPITALLAALAVLCSPAFAAEPPATAPSGTRYAVRAIRITRGESNLPNRQEKIIRKIAADLSPAMNNHLVAVFLGGGSETGMEWQLTLALPASAPATAKESLDQLVAQLPAALRADHEAKQASALGPLQRDVKAETQRMDEASAKVNQLREQLRDVARRADVSNDGIHAAVTKLEEERQRLELETMGKTARREALETQVAELTAAAEQKINRDAIAVELEKIVDVRQGQLKRLEQLHAGGQASSGEVSEAIAAVAEARAKLLERRREAADQAGGETLDSFNRDLLTLSVDLRELKARLEYVSKRLEALRQAMDLLEPLSRAESELAQAREDHDTARNNLRMLQRSIERSEPVTVEVRSAENRAEPPKELPRQAF